MGALPWAKILSMLGPIISAILAAIAANNSAVIGFEGSEPSIGDYGATGVAGFGSVIALVTGLFAAWRQSGTISPSEAAETAALATLATICLSRGDETGGRIIDSLGRHLHQMRHPEEVSADSPGPEKTPEQIFSELTERIKRDAARLVEGSA